MPLRVKTLLTPLVLCCIGLNLSLSAQDGTSTGKCGFQNLTIRSPAGTISGPTALNGKGSIVGFLNLGSAANFRIVGFFNNGAVLGFLLHNGKPTIISFSGAKGGPLAASINDSGVVVGTYMLSDEDVPHGFMWKNGNFTNITAPGGLPARPARINNEGDIVGSFTDLNGIQHGFSLDKGRFTVIDHPSSESTNIFGVNDFDNILGAFVPSSSTTFSSVNFKGFCSAVF